MWCDPKFLFKVGLFFAGLTAFIYFFWLFWTGGFYWLVGPS